MERLDPVAALERLGAVADGSTLRQACDPWLLRVAVAEGRVVHLGHNSYALPGADAARSAAARLRGVVSGLSAAMAWGWKVRKAPAQPVVTVPRNRKLDPARRQGVDVRYADLPASAVHEHLTTRVQTVVDCARWLPFADALTVADSALREGKVTRDQLLAAVQRSPRTGRSRALRVVQLADHRAANPFESCLRAIALEVRGLAVTPQLRVPGIGHADLGDPALRLLIEADSYEFHALEEAFRYDIRRYTAMVRAGWLVVRFCWDDVMHHPELVRSTLADIVALRQRAVRPCSSCPAA